MHLVGFVLNEKKSELDLVQDIQFLGIRLRLDLKVALLPESKAQEIAARAGQLSSLRVLSYHQVAQLMGSLNWASGLIPLGRLYLIPLQHYFHSLGLTDRFAHYVGKTQGPCQLSPAMAGPVFSYLCNPYPSFPGGFYDFHRFPHGRFPNFWYMGPLWTASSISIAWNSRW